MCICEVSHCHSAVVVFIYFCTVLFYSSALLVAILIVVHGINSDHTSSQMKKYVCLH